MNTSRLCEFRRDVDTSGPYGYRSTMNPTSGIRSQSAGAARAFVTDYIDRTRQFSRNVRGEPVEPQLRETTFCAGSDLGGGAFRCPRGARGGWAEHQPGAGKRRL